MQIAIDAHATQRALTANLRKLEDVDVSPHTLKAIDQAEEIAGRFIELGGLPIPV